LYSPITTNSYNTTAGVKFLPGIFPKKPKYTLLFKLKSINSVKICVVLKLYTIEANNQQKILQITNRYKMKKNSFVLFILLILAVLPSVAGNLTGKLINNKSKAPVEFATVALFKVGGKAPVKGMNTTATGAFEFKNIPLGKYILKATYVGYSPFELPIALDEKRPDINLGAISLTEVTKTLNEVKVTGQKSQMRFELDRKVFNVDQNIAAAGASASEVLKNIPSVEVDVQGNVSLRNNSNVIIWINGRPSGLNEDNRAQVLEQMPAETIERIEVITNPSAKFSPDGSAGIINIVLKKDRKAGYYGSVTGGADTFEGYNGAFNINYNDKKWDLFANFGYRRNIMKMTGNADRNSWDSDYSSLYHLITNTDSDNKMGGFFSRFGATYHATEKDHIGINLMANRFNRGSVSDVTYSRWTNNISQPSYTRSADNDGSFKMNNITLDYTHEFAKKGHEIKTAVEFNRMNIDNDNTATQPNFAQNMVLTANRKEIEVSVDYTLPLTENSKFEAGFKGEYDDKKSTTEANKGTNMISLSQQIELNNKFNSNENRSSVYLTYSGKVKQLTYQAGLRGEYNTMTNTSYNYQSNGTEIATPFDKEYPGLYPSLFLNYSLPKGNELQLNYTRRVNRPHGRAMNPYRDVSDSLNISFGNPQLQPEYSNSLELNYIKTWDAHSLSTSVYYRTSSDVMQQVSYVDGKTKYSTTFNITNTRASGVELILKDKFFRFIDLTSTLNLYYSKLDPFSFSRSMMDATYSGSTDYVTNYPGNESYSWTARSIANVVLPAAWMLQVTGGYQSNRKIAQGEMLSSWSVDAGIRKMLFNRKLSINLMARDLFNSRDSRIRSYGNLYTDYTRSIMGGRMFGFSLTYNFGNSQSQKKKTDTKRTNGEQQDMMNGGGEF